MIRNITQHLSEEKRAFSLKDIKAQYGVSLNLIRKEIEDGRLPVRRVGKRILVLAEDLEKWLEQAKL
ncbi:MAG: helix-turn-helix domain-containing protein [Acidobacteria bacterium]|nr:helix-turn-helix domain-containing protein [Acidobacteriota bacterium]